MNERKSIDHELNLIMQDLRELEIRYEQYFAGVEKREPIQNRENLALRLRQLARRRIVQTNLRFRYQNLATRFHAYASHWDRILRLIDEGRFVRHTVCKLPSARPAEPAAEALPPIGDEVDLIYGQLLEAYRRGNPETTVPERGQIASFLEKQKSLIREKFGDREVEFLVETENGKPKIKVRAKRQGASR